MGVARNRSEETAEGRHGNRKGNEAEDEEANEHGGSKGRERESNGGEAKLKEARRGDVGAEGHSNSSSERGREEEMG